MGPTPTDAGSLIESPPVATVATRLISMDSRTAFVWPPPGNAVMLSVADSTSSPATTALRGMPPKSSPTHHAVRSRSESPAAGLTMPAFNAALARTDSALRPERTVVLGNAMSESGHGEGEREAVTVKQSHVPLHVPGIRAQGRKGTR